MNMPHLVFLSNGMIIYGSLLVIRHFPTKHQYDEAFEGAPPLPEAYQIFSEPTAADTLYLAAADL